MNCVLIIESLQVSTYTGSRLHHIQRCMFLCAFVCHWFLLAARCAMFADITEGESIQSLKALWVIPVRGPSGRRSALLSVPPPRAPLLLAPVWQEATVCVCVVHQS